MASNHLSNSDVLFSNNIFSQDSVYLFVQPVLTVTLYISPELKQIQYIFAQQYWIGLTRMSCFLTMLQLGTWYNFSPDWPHCDSGFGAPFRSTCFDWYTVHFVGICKCAQVLHNYLLPRSTSLLRSSFVCPTSSRVPNEIYLVSVSVARLSATT